MAPPETCDGLCVPPSGLLSLRQWDAAAPPFRKAIPIGAPTWSLLELKCLGPGEPPGINCTPLAIPPKHGRQERWRERLG